MTDFYRRHGQLTWPPTPEQWQAIDQELAAIARKIRTSSGGGDTTTLDADNLTSGTVPDDRLINTGVTAGTYGDGTHVPQVTVDNKGRVTSATNVLITSSASVSAKQLEAYVSLRVF